MYNHILEERDILGQNYLQRMSIPYKTFVNNCEKNFEYLVSISHKINTAFGDVFEYFFAKNFTPLSFENMPDYYVCPFWSEVSRNYRFRYIILEHNSGFILMPLRIVDPVNKKQCPRHFVQSYFIMSDFKMTDDIMQEIAKYPIKRFAISQEENNNSINVNFYNTPNNYKDMCRGKWRSKHGINIIGKQVYSKVLTQEESTSLLKDYETIQKNWILRKDIEPVSVKTEISLIDTPYTNKITIGYFASNTNKLLALQVIEVFNKCAYVHIAKSIIHNDEASNAKIYLGDDIDMANTVKRYLGNFMMYAMHKILFEYGIKVIYYLGVTKMNKANEPLIRFKEKFFKNKIFYNLIKE